jgi:hypothetical protein
VMLKRTHLPERQAAGIADKSVPRSQGSEQGRGENLDQLIPYHSECLDDPSSIIVVRAFFVITSAQAVLELLSSPDNVRR